MNYIIETFALIPSPLDKLVRGITSGFGHGPCKSL